MTAAYDAKLVDGDRIPVWWVQLTVAHRCANTYASASAPSTCTASDAGDGARCYFSYGTCQDRANFRAESYTWNWTSADVPLPASIAAAHPNARPMIERVSPIAQKINLSKSSTSPGHMSVTLFDTGGDDDAGPFDVDKSPRNTTRAGLTLARWLAQWPNFGRMTLTVKLGFLDDSFATSDYATKFVGTLSGIETDADGSWTLRAEDAATKLKRKLPKQFSTTVETTALIEPADTTWAVTDAGEIEVGDQIIVPTVSGEKEVVKVTAVDTGAPSIDVTRGTNGTSAGYVLKETTLKSVLDFHEERPMDIVQTVLGACGIISINTASFDNIDLQIGPVALTRRIPEDDDSSSGDDQESGGKLISEVCELFQVALRVNDAGEMAVAMNRPGQVGETFATVDDDDILVNSSQVLGGEPQRLTHVAVKWNQGEGDNDFDLTAAVNGETFVDDYFGSEPEDRREKKIESEWTRPYSSVAWLAAVRWSHVFAFPPRGLEWNGSLRADGIDVGDIIETNTTAVQDEHGANLTKRMIVIRKRPDDDLEKIAFAAQATGFDETNDNGERWGHIAPTATPVYTSASVTEKANYTFWGDASNLVDGDAGYAVS